MDMITLAMAKSYTDEKVTSGGGSGGGVCLPVVELETVIPVRDEEPVPLSESENLVLDKMMESFTPFVLKCKLTNGFNFANLAYLIDTGTIKMVGVLGDIIPGFMNIGDGSGWVTAE